MKEIKISQMVTLRDEESVQKYLQEISRVQSNPLTIEEEVFLAQRIRQGDEQALERLVKANLRFVVSVAKQYHVPGKTLTLSDLVNEGNIGLIKAAQRFDETKGFKFISYAVWWIRQAITMALSEQSNTIRIPLNVQSKVRTLNKELIATEVLLQTDWSSIHLEPENQNIVRAMHVNQISSLDAPAGYGDEEGSLYNLIGVNDEPIEIEGWEEKIISAIQKILPERESRIFLLYHKNTSLEDIGQEFGLTRERVRQIIMRTQQKLQRSKAIQQLKKEYV
jgi:RNA polymerase primary sigma factor